MSHEKAFKPGPTREDLILIPDSSLDLRPEVDIASQLHSYQPIISERNIWAFWDKGFSNSPPWTQRNVISWVRRLGPSWTVRVLDRVEGSPLNVKNYVDDAYFPETFNTQTMTGPHVGPHASDLLRLPLLYLYGGIWCDVGTFLFRHVDDICWNMLEDPSSPFEMAGFLIEFRPEVGMMFNGFIAARKGNGFVKRWHDIFLRVWEGRTDTSGVHAHPLLRHLPGYRPPVEKLSATDLTVSYGSFLDYLAQNLCFERLRHSKDPSDGWDGPDYFENKIFFMDAMQEVYYAQKLTMWDGQVQFDLLATPREGGSDDELRKKAEAFVEDVMANSCTMKLSHGLPSGKEYLAALWDKPENHEADIRPGSFGEYLRYGSVHFEQKRPLNRFVMPPDNDEVLIGGVTEVLGEPPA